MRALHFDPFSGIAGNMTLAALIHAGLPKEHLKNELSKLNLDDQFNLNIGSSNTHGISGIKLDVEIKKPQEHHRQYTDIVEMIEKSSISTNAKNLSSKFFRIVAKAEAKIHQVSIDHVHFHEVGAIDSIIDLVGVAIGIDYLNPQKISSSPLPQGIGEIRCEHGVMPNPAPATIEILRDIPIYSLPIPKELTTPTGAAIIKGLVQSFEFPKSFNISSTGYGIGFFDLKVRPNFLRIFIGEVEDSISIEDGEITKIEVNIDDMSPQLFEPLMNSLFKAGALDIAIIPIQMKKQRPATKLEILFSNEKFDEIAKTLFLNSTTIGFRFEKMKRLCLLRKMAKIDTQYGTIPVKEAYFKDKLVQVTPEYDACMEISHKINVPLKQILGDAQQVLQSKYSI